jgi:Ca2+-binding EF-hand superfamily protein
MKSFNTIMTLAVLCAVTLTSNSYAQDGNGRFLRRHDGQDGARVLRHRFEQRGPSLERLDSDGDARISESEFIDGRVNRISETFERLDDDGDGLISLEDRRFGLRFKEGGAAREEVQGCLQENGVAPGQTLEFADADSDGDNYLSFNELSVALETQARTAFARLDDNADGYVDAAELTAQREARRDQRAEIKDCLTSSRA